MKKGALLVSGQIPICNDAKEITGYSACRMRMLTYPAKPAIPYQKDALNQTTIYGKEYYRSRFHFLQKRELRSPSWQADI